MSVVCAGVGGGVAGGNPRQRGRHQALPIRDHGGSSQGKPSHRLFSLSFNLNVFQFYAQHEAPFRQLLNVVMYRIPCFI